MMTSHFKMYLFIFALSFSVSAKSIDFIGFALSDYSNQVINDLTDNIDEKEIIEPPEDCVIYVNFYSKEYENIDHVDLIDRDYFE